MTGEVNVNDVLGAKNCGFQFIIAEVIEISACEAHAISIQ